MGQMETETRGELINPDSCGKWQWKQRKMLLGDAAHSRDKKER